MQETRPIRSVPTFGTLEPVDIRSCWADEARDFTPWLANPDGLAMLAKAVGMELAVEGTEVAVGPYSADILARDLTTDGLVVIENFFSKLNHDHFGKALTYAAVLGASAVVWIAPEFGDEHRKTVEWLNELANGDLALYAVQLQVWRIGKSEPAPRFDVVISPNEIVRQANEERETSGEQSDIRRLQNEFWAEVRKRLEGTGKFRTLQTPRPQYWFDVALGRSGVHLSLTANSSDKRVGVRVYMQGRVAARALAQLLPMREQIEREIGQPLQWNPYPEKRDKVIVAFHAGDVMDKSEWPQMLDWITQTTVAFYQAFAPRVAEVDLSGRINGDENETEN